MVQDGRDLALSGADRPLELAFQMAAETPLPITEEPAPASSWRSLLLGQGIDPLQSAYRTRILGSRTRTLALVLAVLMLAWIPIDAMELSGTAFQQVVMLRMGLSGLLIALALGLRTGWLSARPGLALAVVILGQCAAFCFLRRVLPEDSSELLQIGYGLFPFIVMAQIALFPLPLLHAAALGLAVLGARTAAALVSGAELGHAAIGDLWLGALLLAVVTWAAGTQFSLLLSLIRARRDASHDALTGLANRRAAVERLLAEIARADRNGQPLSLLMLDLDHFKAVNDRWGHSVGDLVLVETARILRSELRGADLGARFGGEEFLAILPATDAEAAQHVAERIRLRTQDCVVKAENGEAVRVTISIGTAARSGTESAGELVARADAALYLAKRGGRNRVVVAAPGLRMEGPGSEEAGNQADVLLASLLS